MKLTVSREAAIRDIEPGELVTDDKGRWVVDEVRRTLAGVELLCFPEGRTDGRRTSIEFKSIDDTTTVEAGPSDSTEILDALVKMIRPPSDAEKWPYDKAGGVLQVTIGTRVQGKTAGRSWTVAIEA